MKFHGFTCHPTTHAVWRAINDAHADLHVCSSYTNVDDGVAETTFGFHGGDYPVIGARSTRPTNGALGEPERHEYYLMSAQFPDDD